MGNIDAVPADILEPFDYGALGHIHKPMKAGGEFCRYCGTPLACFLSVRRAGKKYRPGGTGGKGRQEGAPPSLEASQAG